jgi:hypothetical protein
MSGKSVHLIKNYLAKVNEDLLSSIQFRAAKIIMNTKVNMSKAALLIELGWEPINDFLNRQRASYFSYINNLHNNVKLKVG